MPKPNLIHAFMTCLLVAMPVGCRTSREVHEIEYLNSTRPPYPVVTASHEMTAEVKGTPIAPEGLADAPISADLDKQPVLARFIEEPSPLDAPLPVELQRPVAPSDEEVLTLEILHEWAQIHNPTLRQSALAVQAARGRQVQAGLYPNPTLGYLASEVGNEGQAGQQGGYVAQTIVTGGKLSVNRALASQVVDRQSWRYETQRIRVFNEVAMRHVDALGAQRIAQLTDELEAIAEEGAEVSRRLFDSQQVGRADVLQAEIQWNQVRILRQNALAGEQAARRRLAVAVGLSELPDQPLSGELEIERSPGSFDETWNQLATESPLLLAARADVERTRWQQRVEQLRPVPNFELLGSVQHDYASDYTIYGAQFGLSVPLFDGNQGNMAAARAEYGRAVAELERLTLALRDRLAEVWQQYEIAMAEVERYRRDILPRAQENLRLTEEAYRLGEFDLLRVLTARQTFFQTNVEYWRSLTALRQAEILLDGLLLSGGLDAPEA